MNIDDLEYPDYLTGDTHMTDPDKTIPPSKAKAAYREAEGWFDTVVAVLLKSPITLGLFIVWTVGMVALGFKLGS